ncbi:MAG: CPBP family intramembrane glutamic endopeptidase [Acidobacteriaceae bacterium]
MLKLLLLIVCIVALWWFVRNDATEYADFKRLTTSAERRRCYGRWVLKSFLTLTGVSIACLLILQRLHAVLALPPEFIPLAARLGAHMPTTQLLDKGFLIGVACGAAVSGILIGVLLAKKLKTTHATLGDVEPLMPRNAAESGWATLLSLNAGFSEELMFRLLLPLLLAGVLHHALVGFAALAAFILATLAFGLMHLYQGVAGVLMTTLMGAVFAGLYLWTGSLWITMAAHAGLDIFALVVRPNVMRLLHRPTA